MQSFADTLFKHPEDFPADVFQWTAVLTCHSLIFSELRQEISSDLPAGKKTNVLAMRGWWGGCDFHSLPFDFSRHFGAVLVPAGFRRFNLFNDSLVMISTARALAVAVGLHTEPQLVKATTGHRSSPPSRSSRCPGVESVVAATRSTWKPPVGTQTSTPTSTSCSRLV